MRDVLDELICWWREGRTVGLATVVGTWQSAPRSPGASMLVNPNGEVTGSVSGGCVEADVYLLAADPDQPPILQRYGVSDDDAFAVGLTCGGVIDIFIQQVSRTTFAELEQVAQDIQTGVPVAIVTCLASDEDAQVGRRLVVWADRYAGSLGSADLDAAIGADTQRRLAASTDTDQGRVTYHGPAGERLQLFVECHLPPPRMIVFGAIDFAVELSRVGAILGYQVTVCDARPVFATARRFPSAADVIVEQPYRYLLSQVQADKVDSRTVLCVLTHDAKFDVPLLEVALRLPVAYVGAMGSRRTHDDRMRRLRAAGLTDAELGRLRSPIGLDLGARTPQETAISIAAEIVAASRGGGGLPLTDGTGTIHHRGTGPPAAFAG